MMAKCIFQILNCSVSHGMFGDYWGGGCFALCSGMGRGQQTLWLLLILPRRKCSVFVSNLNELLWRTLRANCRRQTDMYNVMVSSANLERFIFHANLYFTLGQLEMDNI